MSTARTDLPVYIPVRRLYFGGVRRQSGRGFLSLLGNLASKLLPFAQQYIFPSAKRAVQGITADVLSGERPLKKSLKAHGIGALKGMARSYLEDQEGTGHRQKRRRRQTRRTTVTSRPARRGRRRKTKTNSSQPPPLPAKKRRTKATKTSIGKKQKRSKKRRAKTKLPIWQPNIINSKKPKRILFAPKHGR